MTYRGELWAFADSLGKLRERVFGPGKEISDNDMKLINLMFDPNVPTEEFAEKVLADTRKVETLKTVDEKFNELEESEKESIAKITLDLSRKIRTGKYDPEKDPEETLKSLLKSVPSLIDDEKLLHYLEYIDNKE